MVRPPGQPLRRCLERGFTDQVVWRCQLRSPLKCREWFHWNLERAFGYPITTEVMLAKMYQSHKNTVAKHYDTFDSHAKKAPWRRGCNEARQSKGHVAEWCVRQATGHKLVRSAPSVSAPAIGELLPEISYRGTVTEDMRFLHLDVSADFGPSAYVAMANMKYKGLPGESGGCINLASAGLAVGGGLVCRALRWHRSPLPPNDDGPHA